MLNWIGIYQEIVYFDDSEEVNLLYTGYRKDGIFLNVYLYVILSQCVHFGCVTGPCVPDHKAFVVTCCLLSSARVPMQLACARPLDFMIPAKDKKRTHLIGY